MCYLYYTRVSLKDAYYKDAALLSHQKEMQSSEANMNSTT